MGGCGGLKPWYGLGERWRVRGRRGLHEARPALAAECEAGWIIEVTVRAAWAELSAAVTTKIHAHWILKATARAVHAGALRHGRTRGEGIGGEARRPFLIGMGWMVCQYSRAGPVSSEKHQGTPGTGVEGRGGPTSMVGAGTVAWAATGLGASGWRSSADWLSSKIIEIYDVREIVPI
jgi:hypothetical protein